MTTTSVLSADADTVPAAGPGRLRLAAAALAASAVTVAALVLTHPWGDRLDSSADEVLSYDFVLKSHDSAWPAMLADVFAFGILAFCLAVGVCHLVRDRGRVLATVGSALVVAGGVLFVMGGFAFATVTWFIGELSESAGRELVDVGNDDVGHLLGVEMAGFFLVTLGSLVLAAALWRARAVPRPAIALFVLLTVGLFAGLSSTPMNVIQAAQVFAIGALAVPIWTRADHAR
jgi:hypothetical protein